MKAIILKGIDNFGKDYKTVAICMDKDVETVVSEAKRLSTEIVGYEVCSCMRCGSMNDVTSFFYYMWNRWSREECEIVFKDSDYNHFWNKWCEAYDLANGPRGAAEIFYMMLSNDNRDKLVKRALKCYDGMRPTGRKF